jgi:hypothetical protein
VAHLIHLSDESGRHTVRGIEFELTENNEELAARLGTVRELISRNLGRLLGEGLIAMHGRTVVVANPEKLHEETSRNS